MSVNRQSIEKNEKRKLAKLVKDLPEGKKAVADNLIKELCYMSGTLEELKEHIDEHGAVQWFRNGSQEMWRESPALKSYNTTVQKYSSIYKQLCDLVEKEDRVLEDDPLLDFIEAAGKE